MCGCGCVLVKNVRLNLVVDCCLIHSYSIWLKSSLTNYVWSIIKTTLFLLYGIKNYNLLKHVIIFSIRFSWLLLYIRMYININTNISISVKLERRTSIITFNKNQVKKLNNTSFNFLCTTRFIFLLLRKLYTQRQYFFFCCCSLDFVKRKLITDMLPINYQYIWYSCLILIFAKHDIFLILISFFFGMQECCGFKKQQKKKSAKN